MKNEFPVWAHAVLAVVTTIAALLLVWALVDLLERAGVLTP